MPERLTQKRIEKLACPAGKDRVYVHDETPGLFFCVTVTVSKTFYVYRLLRVKPIRHKLGRWPADLSLDDARKAAAQSNAAIARGEDPRRPRAVKAEDMTFGEMFALHLERV